MLLKNQIILYTSIYSIYCREKNSSIKNIWRTKNQVRASVPLPTKVLASYVVGSYVVVVICIQIS